MVSDVQQSDPVIYKMLQKTQINFLANPIYIFRYTHTHTHIYIFFSIVSYYKTLNIVPYTIQENFVVRLFYVY